MPYPPIIHKKTKKLLYIIIFTVTLHKLDK
jgi:hypothetical protein